MNSPESIPNPEEQALSKEALLEVIQSSHNLNELHGIVVQEDFDVELALIKPPFIGGVKLVANEDTEDVRWARLRFEQDGGGFTATFTTSYPKVREYVLPQHGQKMVKHPYSKHRRMNLFSQISLSKSLRGLEVFKPQSQE